MLVSRTACRAPFRSGAAPRRALAVRATAAPASTAQLKSLLDDASAAGLGQVRFIVLGDGAILESVNNWGGVRYNDVPSRGTLATIASADKSFECHIVLNKVKKALIAKSKAKAGDYDVYAIRFQGEEGKMLLTCLLHGQAGVYQPAAVEAWKKLHEKYGDALDFA
ncbi:hypothetical protein HYH03_010782 [Edaphochlamys debaryana]|uniref:Uncharacterized protein n=1 Tax=Edaphochlamys debaryana TaxID=47281 RepID=A0A835Y4H2_9CHLO|nr:hypothetical protein HYH03_010782 [Edaphochlamys debaryana]|eukprot:KAG2490864.1 hypothetical protein HYH03_010782 [Edaphochlamys debaryana]